MPDPVSPPPVPPVWRRYWLRWALGFIAALLALAAAGFLAIPALVKTKLPEFAEKELHRKASIGEVKINPFTLRVELRDFSLAESDGRPIAAFAGLVADLEWSSITRRAWHLAEIRLTEPKGLLDIAPDGRINLAALLEDLRRDAPKDQRSDGLPRLVVDVLAIERGRADFTDRRAGYSNSLSPIDLRFENLSTLPQDKGPYTFTANTARGGVLRWKGEVSLNPIAANGLVGGEALSLPELAAYLKPYSTAEVSGGKAAFQLPYRMSYRDGRLEASIDNAAFSVEGLAVKAGAASEPFLALNSLRIDRIRADYAKQEVVVGGIVLDQGRAIAKRDAKGVVDILALVKAPAAAAAAVDPKGGGAVTPWKVKVEGFSLDNFALAVEDGSTAQPVVASIGRVTLGGAIHAEFGAESKGVISGLEVGLRQVQAGGRTAPGFRLGEVLVSGGEVDLSARRVNVASVRLSDGQLKIARDKEGRITLARLDKARPESAKPAIVSSAIAKRGPGDAVNTPAAVKAPAAAPAVAVPAQAGAAPAWKVRVERFGLDKFALTLEDRTAVQPLAASIGRVTLGGGIDAEFGAQSKVVISRLEVGLRKLQAGGLDAPLFRLGELLVSGGDIDLAARKVKVASISLSEGQLNVARDRQGRINLLDFVPGTGAGATPRNEAKQDGGPWKAGVGVVTLGKFAIDLEDGESGVALQAQDLGAKLTDVSNDLKHPLRFDTGFTLREGGKISAQGRAVPADGTIEAAIKVERLTLMPVQPMLARYAKLKLASGSLSARGTIAVAPARGKAPQLRYAGGLEVADLRLDEAGGELFAAWKSAGADQLTLTLQPNRLEVPELRLAEVNAKLLIDADRTLNATRLLVSPPPPAGAAPPVSVAASAEATDPFPVLVRRVRVQNATLEFADLSLRPQFGARIHELNGIVNGVSTNKSTRSQIELDGRVNEFGLARIRGELNPFAPRNNTDVSVVFRNIDLVSASTYAMKFAGYRIASGKISLDLNYKLRNNRLEGRNSVVLDQLKLGERVDSPDAMQLPLELALAILKDSDGKIDLDLPVSGNLDDPQFSYGAVIWKAITNVLTRIVTAPFRALGALFGVSADKLESIDFDAGSAALLPPEREKLKQVATVLSKRAQLKLAVPGQYSEAADGLALRVRAVRQEVARRAGIQVTEGDEPGPPDLQDSAVRVALRGLLTERHGAAEWDKRKADAAAAAAGAPITVLERARRIARGEPQVADLGPLYRGIVDRLVQTQPLADSALRQLATRRSTVIVDALTASGIEAARLVQPAVERTDSPPGKPVALKLGLSSR